MAIDPELDRNITISAILVTITCIFGAIGSMAKWYEEWFVGNPTYKWGICVFKENRIW